MLRAMAAGERSLQDSELQAAESHYRDALREGWQIVGSVATVEGRLAEAREAFRLASTSAAENRAALRSLVLAHLQLHEAPQAVAIVTRLMAKNPGNLEIRKLLVQALVANGETNQAVQELEEAYASAPDDPELAYMLALGYLRLKKVDLAERLFAKIVQARPIARTHVLLGRTYRDFGEYERAKVELRAALAMDPRVPHAHFYLGLILMSQPMSDLEAAIAEFQAEVKRAPRDPAANLELGVALVDAQRPEDALAALETALSSGPPQTFTLYYIGRCQSALDRPEEAVRTLQRALELAPQQDTPDRLLRLIHGQLGAVLRKLGRGEEATRHMAEAKRLWDKETDTTKKLQDRDAAARPDPDLMDTALLAEDSPFSALAPAQRDELRKRVKAELARAYLNLGVMQAQAERFPRAVEHLERAVEADPDFPRVQYSLGVAYFNARQYDKAVDPLSRALQESPPDSGLRQMLATSLINSGAYERAVELLRDDLERGRNPSLDFAYGLALVRSGRAAEAERVFSNLLAKHGDSPELSVVLGQAHAQEGDFDAAIRTLEHALELKPDAAEANATLGVIYLKQGKLPEAERALRAALQADPKDVPSANALASVLDMLGRPEEAVPLLRSALKLKPDFADARYVLGKILLGQGAAAEAVEHLEAAVQIAPDDANIHYQLGRAYQAQGRTELAQQEFEAFRRTKAKSRGDTPPDGRGTP
jgi:tetratricopeptide (TPR) repeat protein